jgi:hypothetical protein
LTFLNKEAPMSPRLLYLLSVEHAPPRVLDRIDAMTAAARMPGRWRPRWAHTALVTV